MSTTKVRELNNTLLFGPRLYLTFGKQEYEQACKAINEPEPFPHQIGINGCAYTYRVGSTLFSIVDINPKALEPSTSAKEIIFTIIHEAVHIWQRFRDEYDLDGGDVTKLFGTEGEANAVESICRSLIDEFQRRKESNEHIQQKKAHQKNAKKNER